MLPWDQSHPDSGVVTHIKRVRDKYSPWLAQFCDITSGKTENDITCFGGSKSGWGVCVLNGLFQSGGYGLITSGRNFSGAIERPKMVVVWAHHHNSVSMIPGFYRNMVSKCPPKR